EEGEASGVAAWPGASLASEWDAVARRVAACPWVGLHPMVVRDAIVQRHGARWVAIVDRRALELSVGQADAWRLLAVTGGAPHHLAGGGAGHGLLPLTAWRDARGAAVWLRSAA